MVYYMFGNPTTHNPYSLTQERKEYLMQLARNSVHNMPPGANRERLAKLFDRSRVGPWVGPSPAGTPGPRIADWYREVMRDTGGFTRPDPHDPRPQYFDKNQGQWNIDSDGTKGGRNYFKGWDPERYKYELQHSPGSDIGFLATGKMSRGTSFKAAMNSIDQGMKIHYGSAGTREGNIAFANYMAKKPKADNTVSWKEEGLNSLPGFANSGGFAMQVNAGSNPYDVAKAFPDHYVREGLGGPMRISLKQPSGLNILNQMVDKGIRNAFVNSTDLYMAEHGVLPTQMVSKRLAEGTATAQMIEYQYGGNAMANPDNPGSRTASRYDTQIKKKAVMTAEEDFFQRATAKFKSQGGTTKKYSLGGTSPMKSSWSSSSVQAYKSDPYKTKSFSFGSKWF